MSQQDDERIARKLLDLGSRSDRVQIRNGMTYLDGYALGNGTVEIRSQVARDRRRRFIPQAEGSSYPLKMLFYKYSGDNQGWYVGGWNQEPVFVAVDPSQPNPGLLWDNRLVLSGITATGPGPNDWLVGGWKGVGNIHSVVFFDHTGLIFEAGPNFRAVKPNGLFASGWSLLPNDIDEIEWATSSGATGQRQIPFGSHEFGYVLPSVEPGQRLDNFFENPLRDYAVTNLTLSHAVFVGDRSGNTGTFPNGNPWLASSSGAFTRLNTNLNAAVRRSDLIGLTLYERNVDFIIAGSYFLSNYTFSAPWPNAGEHTLTITPHTITTGGIVTTGTPFPVKYQAPDPAAWITRDASLWQ
jgi:hypothetical protein